MERKLCLHGKDCSYNLFAFPPSLEVRRHGAEALSGCNSLTPSNRANDIAATGNRLCQTCGGGFRGPADGPLDNH